MAMLLLLALAVVISPFLTHYLSTLIFFRTHRSHATGKKPPPIPYWLPGIWPGISIVREGLSTFVANTIKQYGDFAPFVLKAGPFSFLVIRDPKQIKRVFESEHMVSKDPHGRLFDKVFGLSPEASKVVSKSRAFKKNDDIDHLHSVLLRKCFSGPGLAPMGDVYISALSRSLANKMIQEQTWMEIEDLWGFFQLEFTRASIEMIFGPSLLKAYPRLVRDFWEFEASMQSLAHELPQFLAPNAYGARDRLLANLSKWMKYSMDTSAGSKYFQEVDSAVARMGLSYEARASAALSIMHWSNSTIMPSTFWCILETLRNPGLAKHLSAVIDRHFDTGAQSCDHLSATPVFQSLHTEVARLRTATCAIRVNESDRFILDENWTIPKGMEVRMFSQDLALNVKLWAQARPETLERPLAHFWPERFILPSPDTKAGKEEFRTGPFSTEGVESLLTTFSAASNLSPERSLTKTVQAGTLAVLLGQYEIQLSDPDAVDQLLPPVPGPAYGTIKPLGSVRMRIRKRTLGNKPKQSRA